MFEIIKILQLNYSDVYQISFLLIAKDFRKGYFYDRLKELNVSINFISTKKPRVRYRLAQLDKVLSKLFNIKPFQKKANSKWIKNFKEAFIGFDLIVNNKIHLLKAIQQNIPKETPVVHHAIVHSKQFLEPLYEDLDIKELYVAFPCGQMMYEIKKQIGNRVKQYSRISMPASLNFREPSHPQKSKVLKLAYLARLNHDKAFIVVLCAIHELVTRGIPVKCYLVGRKDNPKVYAELVRNIGLLHIENNIEFVNHLENLESLEDYKVDMVLTGGVNDFIGYSSIEIIAAGFPVLTWDQSISEYVVETNDKVFPKAKNVRDFCNCLEYYHNNRDEKLDLVRKQQKFLEKENNPKEIGVAIDELYKQILQN